MHFNPHSCVFSPKMRALTPLCRRTPVSTTRRRYLICCLVSRPVGPSRAESPARPTRMAPFLGRRASMATCPVDPEIRPPHSHSGTWSSVFRGREAPGGKPFSFLKSASSHSGSYFDFLLYKVQDFYCIHHLVDTYKIDFLLINLPLFCFNNCNPVVPNLYWLIMSYVYLYVDMDWICEMIQKVIFKNIRKKQKLFFLDDRKYGSSYGVNHGPLKWTLQSKRQLPD